MRDFFEEPLIAIDMPEGNLVLTFDDGPSERANVLGEYLARRGIQAVFFVVGKRVEEFPDQLRRLHRMGHTIGNHTYSLVYDSSSSNRRINCSLRSTARSEILCRSAISRLA